MAAPEPVSAEPQAGRSSAIFPMTGWNGVLIELCNSSSAVVIRSTICSGWNWIFGVPGRPV